MAYIVGDGYFSLTNIREVFENELQRWKCKGVGIYFEWH